MQEHKEGELRSKLRSRIVSWPTSRFCSEYVFERTPFVFGQDWKGYLSWKSRLGELLGVDAHNIRIVGSGAVGISLNPNKSFRPFDSSSDIDVAVLSAYHFDIAWRTLRTLPPSVTTRLNKKQRQAVNGHRVGHVFDGTIATNSILSLFPFAVEWTEALSEMSQIPPTLDREINIRLYRDADSLRHYQIKSIEAVRTLLLDLEAIG